MKINSIAISRDLQRCLEILTKTQYDEKKLSSVFFNQLNKLSFGSLEQMKRETNGFLKLAKELPLEKELSEFSTEIGSDFTGSLHESFKPGKINLEKLVIIGNADIDTPIALYFEDKQTPIVIFYYESPEGYVYWRKIANNIQELLSILLKV